MYNNPAALGTAGGLAMTGLTGNPIWLFLAVFAMIALGLAILRTVPRREG
jgi:hypothetical protein